MSQFHERLGNWQEAYTWAEMGMLVTDDYPPLTVDVGFPGWYALEFQSAVSAWWIGRKNESVDKLNKLLSIDNLSEVYQTAVLYNLERINATV